MISDKNVRVASLKSSKSCPKSQRKIILLPRLTTGESQSPVTLSPSVESKIVDVVKLNLQEATLPLLELILSINP